MRFSAHGRIWARAGANSPRKGWSTYGAQRAQPVAISGKSAGSRNGENERKPLPWVATGCRDPKMVRRGSTVRVRQRALQKRRKSALFVSPPLQIFQRAMGMEPFMEPSGSERVLQTSEIGAFAGRSSRVASPPAGPRSSSPAASSSAGGCSWSRCSSVRAARSSARRAEVSPHARSGA